MFGRSEGEVLKKFLLPVVFLVIGERGANLKAGDFAIRVAVGAREAGIWGYLEAA